jgi:hypothetical protein
MVEFSNIPFGVRDCKIYPLTVDTPGTATDVPRIRRVELNVVRDSANLEGDDVTVAVQTFAKRMEGSIEAGGINLAVLAVLEGGTVEATTGTMPNRVTTYKVQGSDVEGYFQLIAQAIGNDGGDVHLRVYKCKATSGPTIAFEQGAYTLLACDIQAVFNGAGRLYDLIQHETVTAVA